MKKILVIFTIIFTTLAFCACEKLEKAETYVDVCFSYNIIGSGEYITKSSSEIQHIFEATKPTYVPIELKSKRTAQKYLIYTGQEISLPVGEYEIKIGYSNDNGLRLWDGLKYDENGWCNRYIHIHSSSGSLGCKAYKYPIFAVKEETVIVDKNSSITVNLEYNCSAFIFDNTVISKIDGFYDDRIVGGGDGVLICYFSLNNLSVFYMTKVYTPITLYPYDYANYEETKISTSTAEKGKYYILTANKVETNSTAFSGYNIQNGLLEGEL